MDRAIFFNIPFSRQGKCLRNRASCPWRPGPPRVSPGRHGIPRDPPL